MTRFIKWRHMREGLTLNGSWGHHCHTLAQVLDLAFIPSVCLCNVLKQQMFENISGNSSSSSLLDKHIRWQNSISHHPSVFRALQEENADLHQNLLQTVVCIESLEVELQRTRDELSHVKEKYKRFGNVNRTSTCMMDSRCFYPLTCVHKYILKITWDREISLPRVVWWCSA